MIFIRGAIAIIEKANDRTTGSLRTCRVFEDIVPDMVQVCASDSEYGMKIQGTHKYIQGLCRRC